MNIASRYIITVALAASACTASDSDGIWMPPGGTGKADGFTTIKGSDIPSAYVDPNKSYMLWRNVANLSTLGALDADETSLAKRVDGIIANMPADGLMYLAELVRMEDPTIHKSLFPGEQAALPKLWKLVEAPDSNDTLYGPSDHFGIIDSTIPPGAAVPPSLLAIATLSAELQAPASRLENLYNSDGDTSTVALADLASGIANPAAFTPTEVTAFGTIQAVFRDQAVAHADTKIDVSPGPGTSTVDAMLGPASFHMTSLTKFDETRSTQGTSMTTTFAATQTVTSTVALPTGANVLVLSQDSGTEVVFGNGAATGTVPAMHAGVYTFEVWQNGQRAFMTNAVLPVMASTDTVGLNDKLDYTLISGLSPLVRNLVSGTNGSPYAVHYTYDKITTPPPPNLSQAILTTNTPTLTIPVGRYSLPQVTVYVYANNVMWVSVFGGTPHRMLLLGNSGSAPRNFYLQSSNVTFDAITNSLYCGQCSPTLTVQLRASMRDI